jgi:hypothetical protein
MILLISIHSQTVLQLSGLADLERYIRRYSEKKYEWGMQRPHTKRQANQHGCLPRLLGDGDKGIEIVYGEEKNVLYWAD